MATPFINVKALTKRIAEVKAELTHLLHLESFVGGAGKKRGRPAKAKSAAVVSTGKTTSNKGRKSKKRGALGNKILKFLASKGKDGAHINDIAAAAGTKPGNVSAWVYTTGKNKVKKVKPATYAAKE